MSRIQKPIVISMNWSDLNYYYYYVLDVGSLTYATMLVRVVHTKVREDWIGSLSCPSGMHGKFGLLSQGAASSHSTTLPSFYSPALLSPT